MALWTYLTTWWDWLVQYMGTAGPVAGAAYMLVPLLLGSVMGVWFGWRSGHQAGAREGQAATPILLKEEAFQRGRCPVCHQEARDPEQPPPVQSLQPNPPD